MSTSYYHVYSDGGKFAGVYDREQIEDPALALVPSRPPGVFYKWDFDNTEWVALTTEEIEQDTAPEEAEEPEDYYPDIQPAITTTPKAIALWGDSQGTKLLNSGIIQQNGVLLIPKFVNLNEGKDYFINNRSITNKYYQKVKKTNQDTHDQSSWKTINGMSLTTTNTYPIFAEIKIELLVKITRNNKDFLFGLFINNQRVVDDSLDIDFNRNGDDKILPWSDDFIIQPNSLIEVKWAKVGNSRYECICHRRLLRIKEH